MIEHPIPPVVSTDPKNPPRILILGSFPSVKSRETAFFYGHPQNRFWHVLPALFDEPIPTTIEEKTAFCHTHGIALWDVIAACEIHGSSDASIRNVTPTDLTPLLSLGTIQTIFTNGTTATRLYTKYQYPITHISTIPLPSTSPANAVRTLIDLIEAWAPVKTALDLSENA